MFNSFDCCKIDFIRIDQDFQSENDFVFDHDIDQIVVFVDLFNFSDFASLV